MVNQTNIGTVSKATMGMKPVRDGVKRITDFPEQETICILLDKALKGENLE